MGGLAQVVTAGVPSLAGRNELVVIIWQYLNEAGLLGASGLNATMSGRAHAVAISRCRQAHVQSPDRAPTRLDQRKPRHRARFVSWLRAAADEEERIGLKQVADEFRQRANDIEAGIDLATDE
jgi:hypothetical protein